MLTLAAQNWIFTIAVTVLSRSLILRDRISGRLRIRGVSDSRRVSQVHLLPSGGNLLDALFVTPAEGPARAGVLICHGIGETVAHWEAVQTLLARLGVASLVFNYSGYGKSTGWITHQQCEADTLVAFDALRTLVPGMPLAILGYSLGSGIAVAVAPCLKPSKLIICSGFSTLRKAAASLGVPGLFTRLLPPIWSNVDALKTFTLPVLILHGDADRLFPPEMARQLGSSCNSDCDVIVVAGLSHNGPIYSLDLAYWSLVTSRL